jgi:hypothetical protein
MSDTYAANSLTPHDVVIQDRTVFTRQGGTALLKTVTYFVGDHGPFVDEYSAADATPEKITQGINNQIRLLRSVVSADYPTT